MSELNDFNLMELNEHQYLYILKHMVPTEADNRAGKEGVGVMNSDVFKKKWWRQAVEYTRLIKKVLFSNQKVSISSGNKFEIRTSSK